MEDPWRQQPSGIDLVAGMRYIMYSVLISRAVDHMSRDESRTARPLQGKQNNNDEFPTPATLFEHDPEGQ